VERVIETLSKSLSSFTLWRKWSLQK
jgi:hypothetical protein